MMPYLAMLQIPLDIKRGLPNSLNRNKINHMRILFTEQIKTE